MLFVWLMILVGVAYNPVFPLVIRFAEPRSFFYELWVSRGFLPATLLFPIWVWLLRDWES